MQVLYLHLLAYMGCLNCRLIREFTQYEKGSVLTVKKYSVNELRQMFLDFFETKGHLCKSSYSLVPHNDNSVLLIPAGMAPLKPYFTGQEVPPRTRMAT